MKCNFHGFLTEKIGKNKNKIFRPAPRSLFKYTTFYIYCLSFSMFVIFMSLQCSLSRSPSLYISLFFPWWIVPIISDTFHILSFPSFMCLSIFNIFLVYKFLLLNCFGCTHSLNVCAQSLLWSCVLIGYTIGIFC